jgi:hypothetical protein
MDGRLRRIPRWRWIPIRLELWPHLDQWTVCALLPGTRVHTSRRYFRSGHWVLDQIEARLAEAAGD